VHRKRGAEGFFLTVLRAFCSEMHVQNCLPGTAATFLLAAVCAGSAYSRVLKMMTAKELLT